MGSTLPPYKLGGAHRVTVISASLAVAFLAGLGIGLWYFGGLWFTVRRLPTTRHPALLLLGSFLVRAIISVCGFYVVMQGSGARLVAAFLGFVVIRTVLAGRSAYELTEPSTPQHTFVYTRA
jgi:F1F0 ATPase subunit 2